MDELLVFMYLYVFPAMAIIGFVALITFMVLMPKPARMLFKARFNRKPIFMVCGDEGLIELKTGTPHPEGVVEIDDGAFVLLPRPKPKEGVESNPYEDLVLTRYIMDGLNNPCYIMYRGKSVAVNPKVLASFKLGEKKGAMKNILKGLKEVSGKIEHLGFATLLDPRKIKEHIPRMFTQSQIIAISKISERKGELKHKKPLSKLVIPIGFVIAMLIIGLIMMQMLGGGMRPP